MIYCCPLQGQSGDSAVVTPKEQSWGGCVTGLWRVETRDAAKHPAVHRQPPQQRIAGPKMSVLLRLKVPDTEGHLHGL